MNRDDMIKNLGLIGEKIVINHYSSMGNIVEHSINSFDNKKDLVVNGKTIEVKTQVPWISENSFTVKQNQLRKCRSVDELVFISVPPPRHKDRWAGWMFSADPKKFKVKYYTTYDGREMVLIPREQEAVQPVKKLSDDELSELTKYTVSGY